MDFNSVPLRVDLAGGWLDCPCYSRPGAYVVNVTISPMVSLDDWGYHTQAGLGGSAAYGRLTGKCLECAGWQDEAAIDETGLCVWRSGPEPVLDFKVNPSFLSGRLALYWTGKQHRTKDILPLPRNYAEIAHASAIAARAAKDKSVWEMGEAIRASYWCQLDEGMDKDLLPSLESAGAIAKKYCGSGWGGYGVYLFNEVSERNDWVAATPQAKSVEPYMRGVL